MQQDYFSALPGELCDAIAAKLDTEAVHNLRATCKMLHAKCDRQFVVHHLGVATFMLTRQSLQTLVDFSANSRFAPHIKEVRIALTCFPPFLKKSCGPDPLTREEYQEVAEIQQKSGDQTAESINKAVLAEGKKLKRLRRRRYDKYMHDQHTIRKQGVDLQLLSEALVQLPNMKTITILDHYDVKNMPWGCREVRNRIGFYPAWGPEMRRSTETCRYFHDFCAHAASLVLGAISGKSLQLRTLRMAYVPFNMIIAQDASRSRCATPARTFSEEKFEGLGRAFSKLQEVSLSFFSAEGSNLSILSRPLSRPLLGWLPELLRFWESVQVLEIGGKNLDIDTYPFRLLAKMVGKSAPLFPRLRTLRLSHTTFHTSDLVKLVANHSNSLENLYIYNCEPVQAGFQSLMSHLVGAQAMVSLELIEDRMVPLARWSLAGPSTVPRKLAGLNTAVLRIQKADTVEFQQALRDSIGD